MREVVCVYVREKERKRDQEVVIGREWVQNVNHPNISWVQDRNTRSLNVGWVLRVYLGIFII